MSITVPALRWGILGTGGIAHSFARDLRTAGLPLVAVGSRTAQRAGAFADDFDISRTHEGAASLAADPEVDAVYIATPHPDHAHSAIAALRAGAHVLVEKPFTLDTAAARRIRSVAEETSRVAMEAMWTRYLPHMRRIRQVISDGEIGQVRAIMADHTQSLPTDPHHRLNDLNLGGGALLDLGVYPVSFAIDILGLPEHIEAQGRLGRSGADTEVTVSMRHAGGALSSMLASSRAAGPNRACIIGTAGRIEIDAVWYTKTGFTVFDSDGTIRERFEPPADHGRGMTYQVEALSRYLDDPDTHPLALAIDESIAIMEVLDDIRRRIGVVYPE